MEQRLRELDPSSPTYVDDLRQAQHEAYQQARNLQEGLLDSSLGPGSDFTLSIDGSGNPTVTDPSWAGAQTMAGMNFPKPPKY